LRSAAYWHDVGGIEATACGKYLFCERFMAQAFVNLSDFKPPTALYLTAAMSFHQTLVQTISSA
jgi:hypothetical protein